MKRILTFLVALTMLFAMFGCAPLKKQTQKVAGQCNITVDCINLVNHKEILAENLRQVIPENGIFLEHAGIDFYEGETAHDLLLRLAKHEKLPVDFASSQYGAYIRGIGSLYESDAGPASGWLYTVNGESLQVAADAYQLQPGDVVRFYYVQDFSNQEHI